MEPNGHFGCNYDWIKSNHNDYFSVFNLSEKEYFSEEKAYHSFYFLQIGKAKALQHSRSLIKELGEKKVPSLE